MSDLAAAVISGEFDLDHTMAMNSAPFCRVCLNDNPNTSGCQQFKDITCFTRSQTEPSATYETNKPIAMNKPLKQTTFVSISGMVDTIGTVLCRQTETGPVI